MLMNELIADNKEFTVMPYPGRSHSLSEGRNTERHFFTLLTDYLHKNLPLQVPAGEPVGAAGTGSIGTKH